MLCTSVVHNMINHNRSITVLISSAGDLGSAVHLHCIRAAAGAEKCRQRLRAATRSSRRIVAELNRQLKQVTALWLVVELLVCIV